MKQSTQYICLITLLAPAFLACATGKSTKKNTEPAADLGKRELSIKNESGSDICEIQVYARDAKRNNKVFAHNETLKSGDSIKLSVEGDLRNMIASTCDGKDLYNGEASSKITDYTFKKNPEANPKLTMTDPSKGGIQLTTARDYSARYEYVLRYARQNPKTAKKDSELAGKLLKAIQNTPTISSKSKSTVAVIVSPDWYIFRNKRTGIITRRTIYATIGHQWPSGKCSFQVHGFQQGHNGSDFAGSITWAGFTQARADVGCKMLNWLASQEGASK